MRIEELQAQAKKLGFELFGVTRPEPTPHIVTYLHWVEDGRSAGMSYMASEHAMEMRTQPQRIFPEAQSVVMLGIRYPDPRLIEEGPQGETLGRVAAYAWGVDYHTVIPERLQKLVEWMKSRSEEPAGSRVYTDTGPVLERDLAQQAGLGWIGKNTCLISPDAGSYFFLAEIFTSQKIQPLTLPVSHDFCGSCRRCIDACPTDAILEDRTVDARRCISYLTIENKGEIPEGLREPMGEWVFGCDICQMVCPWNQRFSDQQGGAVFEPRDGIARPVLRHELHLTAQEFNRKFKNSPVQRARRRGYLRNVAVALGNSRDPTGIPDLAEVMRTEQEPVVRSHAAWALGRMQSSVARQMLDEVLKREEDAAVRLEITRALDQGSH